MNMGRFKGRRSVARLNLRASSKDHHDVMLPGIGCTKYYHTRKKELRRWSVPRYLGPLKLKISASFAQHSSVFLEN